MSHIFKTIAFCATLAGSLAGTAYAGTQDVKRVEVPVKAYEVNNAEGAAVVFARIERAAERVCRTSGRAPLSMRAQIAACEAAAIETAINQVDSAHLTAVWRDARLS